MHGTAQSTADTANTTANSALAKANANEAKITALENGNNYSLSDEIDTGKKWINGETIYRKVIQYTPSSIIGASNTTSYVSVPHNISNIGLVTDIHTSRYQGNGVTGFVPNFAGSSSLNGGLSYNVVNTTNIVFKIINDTYSVGSTFYITLEYIKEV